MSDSHPFNPSLCWSNSWWTLWYLLSTLAKSSAIL